MENQSLDSLLEFDALYEAEKLTGKSYKTDEETAGLGLFLNMVNAERKNAALLEARDTTLCNKLADYLRVVSDLGFEHGQSFSFSGREGVPETLYVYAHRQHGFVLCFDTYGGDSVNSAKIHYCVTPHSREGFYKVTSSGRYESCSNPDWRKQYYENDTTPDDLFWSGDHDAREALRHKISALLQASTPFARWPDSVRSDQKSGFYLTNYMDWYSPEYEKTAHDKRDAYLLRIYKERFAQLPDWVKDIIGYSGE